MTLLLEIRLKQKNYLEQIIIIIIFICSDKNTWCKQRAHDKKDSKVEKTHLLLPLNRKRKKHKICIIHYN